MRVLIVEEHPERERVALLLLARELQRAGHSAILSNTWAIESDLRRHRPDVVVDNVSDSAAHFLGKFAGLSHQQRNVNLVWEQAINPLSLFRYRFDSALQTSLVDGRIAWGTAFRDIMLRENPQMDPLRIRACGSIKHAALSLYAGVAPSDLLKLYPAKMAAFDRRVLLVDSFPAADRAPEADRSMKLRNSYAYMFEVITYLSDLRSVAYDLFDRLAQAYPDRLFIVRAHPTKLSAYHERFAHFERRPNVLLCPEGDIGPLLRLSELVVAARSGVLLDAHFVGTRAVNLALLQHPFAQAGITKTFEEDFAPAIAVDEAIEPDLDAWAAAARAHRPDPNLVGRWFASARMDAFANVVSFLEDTLGRPAVGHRVPLTDLTAFALKRVIRNRVRSLGFGKNAPSHATSFPYDTLCELLARTHQSADRASQGGSGSQEHGAAAQPR